MEMKEILVIKTKLKLLGLFKLSALLNPIVSLLAHFSRKHSSNRAARPSGT